MGSRARALSLELLLGRAQALSMIVTKSSLRYRANLLSLARVLPRELDVVVGEARRARACPWR